MAALSDELAARVPTAPIAAGGLIAGFGVAVASGSRPLGGVVLAAAGLSCIAVWRTRDRTAVTVGLTVTGLAAFALSHVLADAIGAWPSVFTVAALTAAACWRFSDRAATTLSPRRPAPQRNKLRR